MWCLTGKLSPGSCTAVPVKVVSSRCAHLSACVKPAHTQSIACEPVPVPSAGGLCRCLLRCDITPVPHRFVALGTTLERKHRARGCVQHLASLVSELLSQRGMCWRRGQHTSAHTHIIHPTGSPMCSECERSAIDAS